jgi:hypothetical protein
MKKQDRDYYAARLRQEEEAARAAADPRAAESHEKLAREYADLIGANDDAPGA